jgi:hypothetical protein
MILNYFNFQFIVKYIFLNIFILHFRQRVMIKREYHTDGERGYPVFILQTY